MSYKDEKYTELGNSVATTEAEKIFLESLRSGHTPLESMAKSKLSGKQCKELMERAKQWEKKNMCTTVPHE
jgi:dynactin complex subunit